MFVRVGGGFMAIREFIRMYTPQEVEKVERRNVVGRFANKTAVQKLAIS